MGCVKFFFFFYFEVFFVVDRKIGFVNIVYKYNFRGLYFVEFIWKGENYWESLGEGNFLICFWF